MSTQNKGIFLHLAPDVVDRIQERCAAEGVPEAQRGRAGGPAEWIRRLIHRELGIPVADPHAAQSAERRKPVSLDAYNYRVSNYADTQVVDVPAGSPVLGEFRANGYDVSAYRVRPGTDLPGRRRYLQIPLKDWDSLAALQRGHGERPNRLPTEADFAHDPIEEQSRGN